MYLSSVLVQRLLLPLQASDPRAFGLYVPGCVCPRLGEGKEAKKKKKMTSFGREVKPWVPCRRFMALKNLKPELEPLSKFVGLFTLYVESGANDLRC